MCAFQPSHVCLLRDFVYPLVRDEPNLFPHQFVHKLHDESKLPLDIVELRRRFRSSQNKHYFVMPEGPPVGRENAIEIRGSKTFWREADKWVVREWGYVYGEATIYQYISGKRETGWCMALYHVDPQGVLKCGPVELGLHQVELRWKAIMIFARGSNFNFLNPAYLKKSSPPLSALSGMYTFQPTDICLLRDFVYPLVRHEPNLFPHPFVHQLHDPSEFPVDIEEMRRRFQSLDPRTCKWFYFVMLEGPPTGEKNAIEIGGTKVFWRKDGKRTVNEGACVYGDATSYTYMHGDRATCWYLIIYRVDLLRVRTCGPVELGLNQVESRWVAVKIFPTYVSELFRNHVPLPEAAPPSDESLPPPPPPSPSASTSNKQ